MMLQALISIAGILITIFFVIGTHESAHFLAARCLGVRVLRFSIGFGKTLFRWHDKKGTEYVVAMIPLGGYVKMLDETEEVVPTEEQHLAYNRQPFYKKFLIVIAGPAANLFCAFSLYWLIFVIGFVTVKPMIGSVAPRSIAAEAGLQPSQEIVSIDNKTTNAWSGVMFRLIAHAGNQDHMRMEVKNPGNQTIQTYLLDLSNWHMNDLIPDPLGSLGITPYEPDIPLIIGFIRPKSPAATSGLRVGDKIIAANNTKIKDWDDLITSVISHPDTSITFKVERQNKILLIPVMIGMQRNLFFQASGFLGIGPNFQWPKELLNHVHYNPIKAIPRAWQEMLDLSYLNLLLFGKMITGKLSLQSLGGPITIFESAGSALNYGFISFIGFLAFLSVSIGIINLFPIPGLDGGHLFIQLIEFIIRRPVPVKIQMVLFRIGFLLIFFILIQALVNDILRLY